MCKEKDKQDVANIIDEVLGEKEICDLKRLGGLTNRTYYVKTRSGEYAVRLPGEGTKELISRFHEKVSTELACELGIDTKLYYFNDNTGVKVAKYIENAITLSAEDMKKKENIILVANTFQKLHHSGVDTKVPFDVIEMAEAYERFIEANGGTFYQDHEVTKKYIHQIKTNYLQQVVKVPCHNDPLCENWVLDGEDKIYLIDWEYAGMNDPMWDLADVSIEAELDSALDELLLATYFGRAVTKQEWEAFFINKVLIDYLWSLWGKTRAVFEGEEMEEYALDRYMRMKQNIQDLEER